MHFTNVFAVAAGAFAILSTTAFAAEVGGKCDANDTFACAGSDFLQCNIETGLWIRQNKCQGDCNADPVFSSYCHPTNTLTQATAKPTRVPKKKAGKGNHLKPIKTKKVAPKETPTA